MTSPPVMSVRGRKVLNLAIQLSPVDGIKYDIYELEVMANRYPLNAVLNTMRKWASMCSDPQKLQDFSYYYPINRLKFNSMFDEVKWDASKCLIYDTIVGKLLADFGRKEFILLLELLHYNVDFINKACANIQFDKRTLPYIHAVVTRTYQAIENMDVMKNGYNKIPALTITTVSNETITTLDAEWEDFIIEQNIKKTFLGED